MSRFKISSEQCDALRGQVCNHLGALADVLISLEHDNVAAAKRLGRQFAEDFRLLEDTGWQPDIDRPACLTMSVGELRRVLIRLQAESEGEVAEPEEVRRAREEDAEAKAAFAAARDACRDILDRLDPEAEGQSGAC